MGRNSLFWPNQISPMCALGLAHGMVPTCGTHVTDSARVFLPSLCADTVVPPDSHRFMRLSPSQAPRADSLACGPSTACTAATLFFFPGISPRTDRAIRPGCWRTTPPRPSFKCEPKPPLTLPLPPLLSSAATKTSRHSRRPAKGKAGEIPPPPYLVDATETHLFGDRGCTRGPAGLFSETWGLVADPGRQNLSPETEDHLVCASDVDRRSRRAILW
jgi:hypothetical protein